jgi:hypothetical protein
LKPFTHHKLTLLSKALRIHENPNTIQHPFPHISLSSKSFKIDISKGIHNKEVSKEVKQNRMQITRKQLVRINVVMMLQ